jgi:hypothetical protein
MNRLDKLFVNRRRYSNHVADQAEEHVRSVETETPPAAARLRERARSDVTGVDIDPDHARPAGYAVAAPSGCCYYRIMSRERRR